MAEKYISLLYYKSNKSLRRYSYKQHVHRECSMAPDYKKLVREGKDWIALLRPKFLEECEVPKQNSRARRLASCQPGSEFLLSGKPENRCFQKQGTSNKEHTPVETTEPSPPRTIFNVWSFWLPDPTTKAEILHPRTFNPHNYRNLATLRRVAFN